MAEKLPTCSVVICTRSRAEQLSNCLKALSEQTVKPLETVVVENGNAEADARHLANEFGARYLHSPEPGLSLARNQGWLLSHGDVVAYIDDDCVPDQRWCEEISQAFLDSSIMAAGGRIIPPDGDELSRGLCEQIQGTGRTEPRFLDKNDEDWFKQAAFGKFGTGGNMAFRRSLLQTWTGFDERLGLPHSSCEDLYAFLTITDLGHRVAYVPTAMVRHPCPMPSASELRERVNQASSSASRYFMFLVFENKRYRSHIMSFFQSGIANRLRSPERMRGATDAKMSGPSLLAGMIKGLWQYLRSRMSHEGQERAFRTSS